MHSKKKRTRKTDREEDGEKGQICRNNLTPDSLWESFSLWIEHDFLSYNNIVAALFLSP